MIPVFVYWTSDGGGADGGGVAAILHRWIANQGNAELIVYGGDVYKKGRKGEFGLFLSQVGGQVNRMCETPGNHEWKDRDTNGSDAFPRGYDEFWSDPAHPSRQPVDKLKLGGARYEHILDLNGWRLIFLDTGALEYLPEWPMGNNARNVWLQDAVKGEGRSRIVFGHHSRLSWGKHGDNKGLDGMWRLLFDNAGAPKVAFTLSGHDHNVSVYKPRNRDLVVTDLKKGVDVWVNGRGGDSFYNRNDGTRPEVFPPNGDPSKDSLGFCVTQIELIDVQRARVRVRNLGNPPNCELEAATLVDKTYDFS
jgi:hypothetical protein